MATSSSVGRRRIYGTTRDMRVVDPHPSQAAALDDGVRGF